MLKTTLSGKASVVARGASPQQLLKMKILLVGVRKIISLALHRLYLDDEVDQGPFLEILALNSPVPAATMRTPQLPGVRRIK